MREAERSVGFRMCVCIEERLVSSVVWCGPLRLLQYRTRNTKYNACDRLPPITTSSHTTTSQIKSNPSRPCRLERVHRVATTALRVAGSKARHRCEVDRARAAVLPRLAAAAAAISSLVMRSLPLTISPTLRTANFPLRP